MNDGVNNPHMVLTDQTIVDDDKFHISVRNYMGYAEIYACDKRIDDPGVRLTFRAEEREALIKALTLIS